MILNYSYEIFCSVCDATAKSLTFVRQSPKDELQEWPLPRGWVAVRVGYWPKYVCPAHRVKIHGDTVKDVMNYDG